MPRLMPENLRPSCINILNKLKKTPQIQYRSNIIKKFWIKT